MKTSQHSTRRISLSLGLGIFVIYDRRSASSLSSLSDHGQDWGRVLLGSPSILLSCQVRSDSCILDRFGRVIVCGFLNSLTLSLILGLQKARKRVRRVEGFAFGSRDFILSRTSNIPSGPSLLATSLSTSNTHFLNQFLSLRDTSRSPGLQAGKKRAEPSGPPTILWRINASTNVPRMIRIIVPASLIILPEL